ncbi:hypothetical protein Tco_0578994, partial [Tanacetum coccineum]
DMDAPTIPVSAKDNLGDPIDIRVDIIHPEPVVAVAFPAAVVDGHGEKGSYGDGVTVGFSSGVTATGLRELQEALGVSHQSAQTSPIDTLF